MNKRKTRPPAGSKAADPEIDSPALEEDEDRLPWELEFDRWAQEADADETELKIVLYRQLKGKSKERVWQWIDEIPDEHLIGQEFGQGQYMVYGYLTGPGVSKVMHRRFNLASSYGNGTRMSGGAGGPAGGLLPFPTGTAPAPDPFAMVDRIMTMFTAMQAAQRPAGQDHPLSHWEAANAIVGRVVEASAQSQLKLSGEVSKMVASNGRARDAGEEEEPTDEDWTGFLKDMIKEHGPSLIEAVGLKLKGYAGVIRQNEVFTALASDKNLFARVVRSLQKDPEMDPEMVGKVLDKLGRMGLGVPLPPEAFIPPPPRPSAPAQVPPPAAG